MNCHQTQIQLSFYLYGELDFATEEALESHLENCAFCQQALAREKTWHSAASSQQLDVPLMLLNECRRDLKQSVEREKKERPASRFSWRLPSFGSITPHRWSLQLAAASFLVFVGFYGGRFVEKGGSTSLGLSQADLAGMHVRDIQRSGPGQVKIVLDETAQKEIVGNAADKDVQHLLLLAAENGDPSIRVDSLEILNGQSGAEVRDILLSRAQRDPNAAVRLKALEAVRRFSDEPETRKVLRSVLEHDDSPEVRAEAIDVLAPPNRTLTLTPEMAATLQNMVRSEPNEYVRMRCLQLLGALNSGSPVDVY